MATKKSGKGERAKASRAKTTARGRTTKPTPKKTAARTAKPVKAAKTPAAAKRAIAKIAKPAAESAEVRALKRERSGLEKRLTEAVREIGLLRHHELRAGHFETQLRDRDETIARLQRQLVEAESRPAEAVYEREVQQSFVLSTPPAEADELADDPLADDEQP